jgi:cyclase
MSWCLVGSEMCIRDRDIGEESNMPFAVGGGIKTLEDIRKIISAGAEKVIINSAAAENPSSIKEAAEAFGSSTIVVCMDIKKKLFGNVTTWINGGSKSTGMNPIEFAKMMEAQGAGELIIQSIERDGKMEGYDLDIIRKMSEAVTIPIVALGGAGKFSDLTDAFHKGFANGLAAGSLFVYQGTKRGVLINYPDKNEINFQ